MIYVFLLILIGAFLYLGINFFRKNNYSKKELIIIFCLIILSLSGIAYNIVPGVTNDLYSHFETITKIKTMGFFTETSVDNIFIIKILFYIISLINNYHLLSMIIVLFTYSTFFFLIFKYHDNIIKFNKMNIIQFILLFLGLCNFYYISTGVKMPMAYSFIALSLYFLEQNKKHLGYLLMGVSVFCHGSSLILIGLYFISKLKVFRTKYRYLLLLTFLIMNISGIILSKIPISIISYIGNKIMMYVNRGSFLGNPIVLIIEILFGCLFIYRCGKVIEKKSKKTNNIDYLYYIQSLSLLGIGTILITEVILERMLMLIAFLVPILIINEEKMKVHKYKLIDILCSLMLIAYFFVRMINHVTFL